MKGLLLMIGCALVIQLSAYTESPCDCEKSTTTIIENYKKGDFQKVITNTAKLHVSTLSDRLKIMKMAAENNPKQFKTRTHAKLTASLNSAITKIKSAQRSALKIKPTKENLTAVIRKIQIASSKPLRATSLHIWKVTPQGWFKKRPKPPVPGEILPVNRCNDENFMNDDCTSVAAGIVNDCQEAIEMKQECQYYSQFSSPQEAQNALNDDIANCNSIAQNQQALCEQANSNCKNYGGGYGDMFQFQRAAAMACNLRDDLSNPVQTETSTGN